jgi:hypothetical protein
LPVIRMTAIMLPDWLTRAGESIRRFAVERPGTLFLVLLALNSLARPCSVTAHDARLYSLQALNAANHGAYADDLFLRFGSQDQFSLFSRLVGPVVGAFGLRVAFFCWYVTFNTLFVYALFRLVRALIDDALIATLALVFLVTAPLPYGGHDIFFVHEQFFTPRTIGTALTLFAVERLLRLRFVAGFALLLAASAVHPLMAFGGVMIGVGLLVLTYLPARACLALLGFAVITGTIVLCVPAVGTKLFGAMDDDWHERLRISVPYNYPDAWSLLDWLNVAVSFTMPIFAITTLFRDDPMRRRFFLAVTIAGAVGFLATCAASLLPYALLFQAQPYRVMWILKVLQIPLAFVLISRWSQAPSHFARIAALALIAFYCNSHALEPEWKVMTALLAISLLLAKMTAASPDQPWLWYGAARGFALGAIGWMAFRWWFYFANRAIFAQHFDFHEFLLFDVVSPVWCLVAFAAVAAWAPLDGGPVRWCALTSAVLAPVAFFMLEGSPDFRRAHTRLGSDMDFVREVVQQGEIQHPTIYASFNRPDLLWIDVGANSYFDVIQTAGVIFRRETAKEVERRAKLVGKFEMQTQRNRDVFLNDAKRQGFEALFQVEYNGPPPSQDDLIQLAAETALDYIVIPQEFPGLYSATNGRVYVYDCAKVRAVKNRLAPNSRSILALPHS